MNKAAQWTSSVGWNGTEQAGAEMAILERPMLLWEMFSQDMSNHSCALHCHRSLNYARKGAPKLAIVTLTCAFILHVPFKCFPDSLLFPTHREKILYWVVCFLYSVFHVFFSFKRPDKLHLFLDSQQVLNSLWLMRRSGPKSEQILEEVNRVLQCGVQAGIDLACSWSC